MALEEQLKTIHKVLKRVIKNLEINEIEPLAQDILKAFNQINPEITYQDILNRLEKCEKKGQTNCFTTIQTKQKTYLLRISGDLYPPYQRKNEEKALNICKENNVETTVLYHSSEKRFQICEAISADFNFSEILNSNNTEEINTTITLIAKELPKFHKVRISSQEYTSKDVINYPQKDLLQKVQGFLDYKFKRFALRDLTNTEVKELINMVGVYFEGKKRLQIEEKLNKEDESYKAITFSVTEISKIKEELAKLQTESANKLSSKLYQGLDYGQLQPFSETCDQILLVLNYLVNKKVFSHGELFADSIYVDIKNSRVMIVDWEYCGLAYWTHDLAVLWRYLDIHQKALLANTYHAARSNSNVQMPEEYIFELKLNAFLCEFIDLGWKISPDNILEYQDKLDNMQNQHLSFKDKLAIKYKYLTETPKIMSMLFRSVQEIPYKEDNENKNFCDLTIITSKKS